MQFGFKKCLKRASSTVPMSDMHLFQHIWSINTDYYPLYNDGQSHKFICRIQRAVGTVIQPLFRLQRLDAFSVSSGGRYGIFNMWTWVWTFKQQSALLNRTEFLYLKYHCIILLWYTLSNHKLTTLHHTNEIFLCHLSIVFTIARMLWNWVLLFKGIGIWTFLWVVLNIDQAMWLKNGWVTLTKA